MQLITTRTRFQLSHVDNAITPMILHISSRWVKIRLYTENQLPRLPGCALKVPVGWWWVGSYPSQAPTHVEIELGCDNLAIFKILVCK